MPLENAEGLDKNPDLELAQFKFVLGTAPHRADESLKKKLMDAVVANDMAPFYEELCPALKWESDETLFGELRERNVAKLKELDEAIAKAEDIDDDSDIRCAYQAKAEYLCRIGAKEKALNAFRKTLDKCASDGQRIDLTFSVIRIGLFYMDHDLVAAELEAAKKLMEEGGDWDRRNRLKVYEGVYRMATRKFQEAARLFLDTVSTFTAYELIDYPTFVRYTVYVCMVALPRVQLRSKVVRFPDLQQALYSIPDVRDLLMDLHKCFYDKFLLRLADTEQILKIDRFWAPHYRFFVKEMRAIAYLQLLNSYEGLSTAFMARRFGVSVQFMEKELFRFIRSGRLRCKIDRVTGTIVSMIDTTEDNLYRQTIKEGDQLLNRVSRLGRVLIA